MQLTTKEGASRTDMIAFALLLLAVMTAMAAFAVGRDDPSAKTAVLLCITNLVTALSSIAATLLVGKAGVTHQVETKEPARLTTAESQSTTSVQPLSTGDCGPNTITNDEDEKR